MRFVCLFTVTFLLLAWLTPLMFPAEANAAQLTTRSVTLSSGASAKTGVTYSFTFSIGATSTSAINGLKFIACDSAYGTYNAGNTCQTGSAANALSFTSATAVAADQSGFGTNSTAFAVDGTGSTYCTPAANVLCAKRTGGTAETGGSVHTVAFSGVTNPTLPGGSNGYAFYIGIYTYNAITNSTPIDGGTVASAVVQTLTVNAQVAEVLQFCVGNTAVNDATTLVANDCSGVSNNSVNLGTLDSSQVNITPWSTDGGDSNNGVAMVRSNAGNGVSVAYDAIQASTGSHHLGTLRLSGATCNTVGDPGADANGNTHTDGCINAAGTTQTAFTAGTEMFGMTIAGVNCGSTSASSYSCVYASGTNNLQQQTNYIGGADNKTYGASAAKGFAWDESGTSRTIASSASSTIKQVDDEALILAFAATPSITTPFGAYSVSVDFTAVPVY